MVDLLRRSMAPLTEETWHAIDAVAAQVLKSQLTARRIVGLDGPHGWEFAAVNLGRLDIPKEAAKQDVPWGKRLVLPLVETRVPFALPQMELDGIARGAKDPMLDPVVDAARRIARFEETAVYNGFEPGGIEGILPRCTHSSIPLPGKAQEYPGAVARAVREMRLAGIEGPFALVLGVDAWAALMQSASGCYPPYRTIEKLLGGALHMTSAIHGGLVLSTAKGYFELTVGQDFAVGYGGHDHEHAEVNFYLTESFTFRVLEPKAAVRLDAAPGAG